MGRQVVVEGCKVVGHLTRGYDFDFDGRAPTFHTTAFTFVWYNHAAAPPRVFVATVVCVIVAHLTNSCCVYVARRVHMNSTSDLFVCPAPPVRPHPLCADPTACAPRLTLAALCFACTTNRDCGLL